MTNSSVDRVTGNDPPLMKVTLAGESAPTLFRLPESSLTTALDEAVAALGSVCDLEVGDNTTTPVVVPVLLKLIEAMSISPSRRDAATRLVEAIAVECSDCTIRCGFGNDKLTRLVDARLGWLGNDSSIFQSMADRWATPRRRDGDARDEGPVVLRDEANTIEIQLPQPGDLGRCVIWIEGKTDLTDRLTWLRGSISTIGSVLWSRPLTSFPAVAVRVVRRSSILVAAMLVILTVLAIWPVHYRIACTARVETTQQRLISTPFEATLLESKIKPGDTVQKGDVLLVLDGRPLRLEREGVEAEMQQVAKEHDVALATGRIAESQQSTLKKRQLQRQFQLLSERLERLEVVSPIDGVVVSGDLERYVGAPLDRGQTLIEVAPLDRMIIEVEIPEHEIGYVSHGAQARIKIDAIGGKSMDATLTTIYPSAELREDKNVFVGRIELQNQKQQLKPGMRGKAVTYGPLRPWIWPWVRGIYERTLWAIGY